MGDVGVLGGGLRENPSVTPGTHHASRHPTTQRCHCDQCSQANFIVILQLIFYLFMNTFRVGNIELVGEDTIVLMATPGSEQKRLDTIQFSTTVILYAPGEVYDKQK